MHLPPVFVIMCHHAFDWQVLQKLGKADETKDVAFEEGVINFNKQYVSTIPTFGCHFHAAEFEAQLRLRPSKFAL